jgi:hypothetical protein
VDLLTIIVCSVDIGGLADHHWFVLLILVDLLTIIVCSVDISGLADHHCLFC